MSRRWLTAPFARSSRRSGRPCPTAASGCVVSAIRRRQRLLAGSSVAGRRDVAAPLARGHARDGKTTREAIPRLKRYLARRVWHLLQAARRLLQDIPTHQLLDIEATKAELSFAAAAFTTIQSVVLAGRVLLLPRCDSAATRGSAICDAADIAGDSPRLRYALECWTALNRAATRRWLQGKATGETTHELLASHARASRRSPRACPSARPAARSLRDIAARMPDRASMSRSGGSVPVPGWLKVPGASRRNIIRNG